MNKKIQDILNFKYFFVFYLLGLLLIVFGLNTTPDSFAYIDGAKNIITNGKYVYDANGLSITLFPPGYSLLISVLFICFGYSVTPIIVLNTFNYTFLAILFYRKNININKLLLIALFSIYINIISGSYSMLLSETIFIPVFLFWYSILNETKNRTNKILILVLELLMISLRYASILLIFSYYAVKSTEVLLGKRTAKEKTLEIINLVWIPFLSLIYFIVLRSLISGTGSKHQFILGAGKYNFYEYPIQFINDVGSKLIGHAVSFQLEKYHVMLLVSIFILVFLLRIIKVKFNDFSLKFIIVAFIVHVVFLSNVWVDDALNGRYLIWFWMVLFFNAKIELRTINLKSKLFVISLILFQFVDLLYFDFKAIENYNIHTYSLKDKKEFEFNNFIPVTTKFKTGIFQSNISTNGNFSLDGEGQLSLVSPCYKWNLPQEKK